MARIQPSANRPREHAARVGKIEPVLGEVLFPFDRIEGDNNHGTILCITLITPVNRRRPYSPRTAALSRARRPLAPPCDRALPQRLYPWLGG
jgi:hypothetical protein